MEYKIINGSITYGPTTILEQINFEIKNNDKIAIVGRNGSGKTSLLKSLIDNDLLETGIGDEKFQIIKIGKPTIGYQTQHVFSDLTETLLNEILKVYSPILKLENKLKILEKQLEENATSKTVEDYINTLETYKILGGYSYKSEYEQALLKFGFSEDDKKKKLSQFSGGQQTKIAFLKLLLSKPDILLLDEPTNHLDITTIEWLEKYLSNYPKAVVIVSHDRMFLDKIVNKVYEIEYASLTKYKGNYSSFEQQKKENYEKQQIDYEYQQKEIKRLQSIADRFRYKPSKAKMAMSKLKKIEQMTKISKPLKYDLKTFNTTLKAKTESSNIVLSTKDLEIGYNNQVLAKVNFELYKGQKLAIIGDNGKGKSTLIKTLMGTLPKINGKVSYGFNVKIAYFDQQLEFINEKNTVYEEYFQTFPNEDPLQIRKTLGCFMFTGDDVFKQIENLSGGEKVRLALCKILKTSPNLLLLDEPTNHLDIIGKESLEDLLVNYNGSIIFVSHDRYFINKIADSLLVFENNKIIYFKDKYEKYLSTKKETIEEQETNKTSSKKETTSPSTKTKNNSLIRKIEKEIDQKEKKKKEIEMMMLDENVYNDYKKMNELQQLLSKIDNELEEKLLEWEKLCS